MLDGEFELDVGGAVWREGDVPGDACGLLRHLLCEVSGDVVEFASPGGEDLDAVDERDGVLGVAGEGAWYPVGCESAVDFVDFAFEPDDAGVFCLVFEGEEILSAFGGGLSLVEPEFDDVGDESVEGWGVWCVGALEVLSAAGVFDVGVEVFVDIGVERVGEAGAGAGSGGSDGVGGVVLDECEDVEDAGDGGEEDVVAVVVTSEVFEGVVVASESGLEVAVDEVEPAVACLEGVGVGVDE